LDFASSGQDRTVMDVTASVQCLLLKECSVPWS